MRWLLRDIMHITAGELRQGKPEIVVAGVAIDSRCIDDHALFVAIKGENHDGHDFIEAMVQQRGIHVLVNREWVPRQQLPERVGVIAVANTLDALQQLAAARRKLLDIPVIGITGSNGKTTTKEIVAALLSTRIPVAKSRLSFNNHIGVPLTVLGISDRDRAAVLELGMNHSGEIRRLSAISRPTTAVITNVSEAHVGLLGSLEQVARAKCELLEHLEVAQTAVVNADCPILMQVSRQFPSQRITFGIDQPCDYRADRIVEHEAGVSFRVNSRWECFVPLLGRHNVYNVLAAIAAVQLHGVDEQSIQTALNRISPMPLRMQPHVVDGIQIIVDCYNANPASMAAAVQALAGRRAAGRRVMVMADMQELGAQSRALHQAAGTLVADAQLDALVTVGPEAAASGTAARAAGMTAQAVICCQTNAEAAQQLRHMLMPGDIVMLKGSRRMRLEELITLLSKNSNRDNRG